MNESVMSFITGSENDFIRTAISVASKGSDVYEGILYNGTLYVIVNDGLVYEIDVKQYIDSRKCTSFTKESLKMNPDSIEGNLIHFKTVFDKCYNVTQLPNTYPQVFFDHELRGKEEFESIVNAKSGDGSFRYYIDSSLDHRSFMIIQKSMFNLNKPDTISLKVYDIGANLLLSVFDIHKKKSKLNVKLYFIFMDLNNSKRGV